MRGAGRAEKFDVFFADGELGLYVVVDGQIDRSAAPIALRAFVEGLRVARGCGEVEGALSTVALAAHQALRVEAPNTAAELAAVWMSPGGVRVCSVGAARCYREHEGIVVRLTTDDVLWQNVLSLWPWPDPMPDEGDFDAWDTTPRILGGPRPPRVSEVAADAVAGDTLLVSTDGLTWSPDDDDRVVRALVCGRGEAPRRYACSSSSRSGQIAQTANSSRRFSRRGARRSVPLDYFSAGSAAMTRGSSVARRFSEGRAGRGRRHGARGRGLRGLLR